MKALGMACERRVISGPDVGKAGHVSAKRHVA